MDTNWNEFPWATVLTVAVVLIVAIVGGAVVLFGHDGALSFDRYVTVLTGLAVATGLLGIGRGIRANGKFQAHKRS